ncbi:MAG: hypothetical protein N2652_03625 [Kiritimatiellae bacterium]|nr:hypothetical protein [Kiritimatiellia bacterium]
MIHRSQPAPRARSVAAWIAAAAAAVRTATAWGPHAEITAAAMARIPSESAIRHLLGPEWETLTTWCWLPDRRRALGERAGELFHTDDFLHLPGVPPDVAHTMPVVATTWAPHFQRALDALRMETPRNAARWVGTLLHYVQDSGAPPHAWPRGPHGPMENWVPADRIAIPDHVPRMLCERETDAPNAFASAMRVHVADAAERGQRIEPLAAASNRPAVEAIALISANESAKLSADVLETLGRLAMRPRSGPEGELCGRLRVPAVIPRPKVMIAGRPWSTVCDAEGQWSLRGVPAGEYELLAAVPGCPPWRARARVGDRERIEVDFAPAPPLGEGSTLMNPDFSLRWVRADAPDYWHRQKDAWESEAVPVTGGREVQLQVDWVEGTDASLVVRWRNTGAPTGGRTASEPPLRPGESRRRLVVPEWAVCARIDLMMRTADPTTSVRRIVWTASR